MKKTKVIIIIIMFLSGVAIAAYPVVSNLVHQKHATQVIDSYKDSVQEMDRKKIDAAKESAKKYNEQLRNVIVRDARGEGSGEGVGYVDMADIGDSLGYITIPKINVNLPIYRGTSAEALANGVGYMEQYSFPIGGESTHSVLTGHRGLPDAVLFTDMDKMAIGDCFYLHILDQILAYRVDRIKVVEPDASGELDIIEGEDYCTLVTCTPYSVNTHRLLVRGTRTEYTGEEQPKSTYQTLNTGSVTKRLVDVWSWLVIALIAVFAVEGVIVLLFIRSRRKRK